MEEKEKTNIIDDHAITSTLEGTDVIREISKKSVENFIDFFEDEFLFDDDTSIKNGTSRDKFVNTIAKIQFMDKEQEEIFLTVIWFVMHIANERFSSDKEYHDAIVKEFDEAMAERQLKITWTNVITTIRILRAAKNDLCLGYRECYENIKVIFSKKK